VTVDRCRHVVGYYVCVLKQVCLFLVLASTMRSFVGLSLARLITEQLNWTRLHAR